MGIQQVFKPLQLEDLISTCKEYKEKGYRLAQIHPRLERDDSITLFYTFVSGEDIVNFRIAGIQKDVTEVPSVTELFIAAFVFENEAHDLFGVKVVGNVLDFHGEFYQFAEGVKAPMTILSPEQIAAREKAAKVAAAKAARAAKAREAASTATTGEIPVVNKEKSSVDIDAKLAGLAPEKAAKVRAALEAKAKREAANTSETEGE